MKAQPICWQADTMGQFHNDLFVAEFLDHVTNSKQNAKDLREQYDAIDADKNLMVETSDIVAEYERKLFDLGFTVEWNSGVYIWANTELPETQI